ncbi:MAG: histidine kinase dimerization/phosphoacceptor domain -containing protein [Balneolaceae bacterium]
MVRDDRPIHLLIIEDNPGDYLLTEEYLREVMRRVTLTQVTTWSDARTELLKHREMFDAILLDLSLPDKKGQELVESLLELSGPAPVIVLTGYRDLDFSVQTLSTGVSDYLLKDELSPTLLYKSIRYSMERRTFSSRMLESERSYRSLFNLTPLPMWLFDLETLRFLDVNQAAIQNYGYSKEEFLSMTIRDLRAGKEEQDQLDRSLQKARGAGHFSGMYAVHTRKGGEPVYALLEGNDITYNGRDARIIVANDITEKQKQEQALVASLKEKETLLAEIHHRVKNNLAVVSAMMMLQADQAEGDRVQPILYDSMRRIKTMANVHEHLYRSSSFSRIDFSENLRQLIEEVSGSMAGERKPTLNLDLGPVELNINQAVPCSLIANEVITNVLKHAFPDSLNEEARIHAGLFERNGLVTICIEDNGVGLPSGVSDKETRSLGFQLIESLVLQLQGSYEYRNRPGGGTRFELRFEPSERKGAANVYMQG